MFSNDSSPRPSTIRWSRKVLALFLVLLFLVPYASADGMMYFDNQEAVITLTAAQILYATFPLSILCGASTIILPDLIYWRAGTGGSGDVRVYDRVERMGISIAISVMIYILFSMIASLIAGMLVFRKKKAGAKTLLLHGLWNCTTFIGMALATRKKFPLDEYGKRSIFILAFYCIFALLLTAYIITLCPSLVLEVFTVWIAGLLSPLVALLLLPYFLFNAILDICFYHSNRAVLESLMSIILFIGVIAPLPLLRLLKQWLDSPDAITPLPVAPEKLWTPPYTQKKVSIGMVIMISVAIMECAVLGAFLYDLHAPHEPPKGVAAMAKQPDAGTIIVTYVGGQDEQSLITMTTTVTDSHGQEQTKFLGIKNSTHPLAVFENVTFSGSFSGNDHVVATAHFGDGKDQVILDSYL
jgi:hypothetical protein